MAEEVIAETSDDVVIQTQITNEEEKSEDESLENTTDIEKEKTKLKVDSELEETNLQKVTEKNDVSEEQEEVFDSTSLKINKGSEDAISNELVEENFQQYKGETKEDVIPLIVSEKPAEQEIPVGSEDLEKELGTEESQETKKLEEPQNHPGSKEKQGEIINDTKTTFENYNVERNISEEQDIVNNKNAKITNFPQQESEKTNLNSLTEPTEIKELDELPTVKTVAYNGRIISNNGEVYNVPISIEGAVPIARVAEYTGEEIIVRREGQHNGSDWILAENDGEYIGWMLKNKITPSYETVISNKTVAYNGLVSTNGRYQLFNRPAYTKGNYQVADSSDYYGNEIIVRGEIQTDSQSTRTWALIEYNDNLIGWINRKGILPIYSQIIDKKTVAYNGSLDTAGRYQIFNRPAYTKGNYRVADSADYYGEDVIVRGEILTDYYGGTTWALIEKNGYELGWINSNAVEADYANIIAERIVAYRGQVDTQGRYQIFSRPAYTKGNYQVADSLDYYQDEIIVRGEIDTDNGVKWLLIENNGYELGWINSKAVSENYDYIISTRYLNNPFIIRNLAGRYQLFNVPAYTQGNYQIDNISNYTGLQALVTEERTTDKGTIWFLVEIDGQTVGWANEKALRKPRVYIDPGHGGYESGASFAGVHEKNLNLNTSKYLEKMLKSKGYYKVMMSREGDTFVSLEERTEEANAQHADIFVSIHYNSMGGSGVARGIETFIYHRIPSGFGQETDRTKFRTDDPRIKESLELADAVHNSLIQETGLYDRGVKGNNFHVLRESDMPAILVELGFLDNMAERTHVNSATYQKKAATAIVRGINDYFIS